MCLVRNIVLSERHGREHSTLDKAPQAYTILYMKSSPQGLTASINLRLTPRLHTKLKVAARQEDIPLPVHIRRVLERSTQSPKTEHKTEGR